MNNRYNIIIIGLLVFFSGAASADFLDTLQLDGLNAHLTCLKDCEQGRLATVETCKGKCPGAESTWEKDGEEGISFKDFELAQLENWDEGARKYLCYGEKGEVIPIAFCGLEECLRRHTAQECSDDDGDTIRNWQDPAVDEANQICEHNTECGGFDTICRYHANIGQSICEDRTGPRGASAFHLQQVSVDNAEVIVRVFYDYSPIPAKILQLRVEFDATGLRLVDARPLTPLKDAKKELYTSVELLGDETLGRVRLLVMSESDDLLSTRPIPMGSNPEDAIVELIFERHGSGPGFVRFSESTRHRRESMAPYQGDEVQPELEADERWTSWDMSDGESDSVPLTEDALVLSYSFDNLQNPLDPISHVISGEALCQKISECANLEDHSPDEAKEIAMLRRLQQGVVQKAQDMEGVNGRAAYLGRSTDHLELPVWLRSSGDFYRPRDQSYSFSTWIFPGGSGNGESATKNQFIFSHNTQDERTQFGLILKPNPNDGGKTLDLVWFDGDLLDSHDPAVVHENLVMRKWTHIGWTVNADSGEVNFYVNGAKQKVVGRISHPLAGSVLSYPVLKGEETIGLHKEGHFEGGITSNRATPEGLFLGIEEKNRTHIDRIDMSGVVRRTLLENDEYSYQDPDYSPDVHKLVYSSNESGNYEIWTADADGANRTQITSGFGDTERGIFARKPVWAPGGEAIVFESNMYSVQRRYNTRHGAYQLYMIPYSPREDKVVVPISVGSTAESLDFEALEQSDIFDTFRVSDTEDNHRTARFLTRDTLVFQSYDKRLENWRVRQVTVKPIQKHSEPPDHEHSSSDPNVTITPGIGETHDTILLDAIRQNTGGETRELLLREEWSEFKEMSPTSGRFGFTFNPEDNTVSVVYEPKGFDGETCWDLNLNGVCDGDNENRNKDVDENGKAICDVKDCYLVSVNNLFLSYKDWELDESDPDEDHAGSYLEQQTEGKEFDYKLQHIAGAPSMVELSVRSPISVKPIPAGAEIARLRFAPGPGDVSGIGGDNFELKQRVVHQKLVAYDYVNEAPLFRMDPRLMGMEEIREAVYSPDGTQIVANGISKARPALRLYRNLHEFAGATAANPVVLSRENLSIKSQKTRGLSWTKSDRYYPSIWVGAVLNVHDRTYTFPNGEAYLGGIDEVKVHNYLREAISFESEAERGLERLHNEERDKQLEPVEARCENNLDCPEFFMCNQGDETCELRECDIHDETPCPDGGFCTLLPFEVDQGTSGFDWVCAAECNNDRQCYGQECMNGPCGICDDTSLSCYECRKDKNTIYAENGDIVAEFEVLEGCPDQNSFDCVDNSCESDCYAMVDGESKYLCDKATQYCRRGRCELINWQWIDLEPATLMGLGEMRMDDSDYRTAISELIPIKIWAYGVRDYVGSPTILVEAKYESSDDTLLQREDYVSPYKGWFEVGRVSVDHYRSNQADTKKPIDFPYALWSPHRFTSLRLRLVNSSYYNMNFASTGLRQKDFCWKEAQTDEDRERCTHTAPGSRAALGYRSTIPRHEVMRACAEQGKGNCTLTKGHYRDYLYGGHHAVVITGVAVNGAGIWNDIDTNKICAYEGKKASAVTCPDGDICAPRKIFYGNGDKERSNQKKYYSNMYKGQKETLVEFAAKTKGEAVLNCNFADPTEEGAIAKLEFSGISLTDPTSEGNIKETKTGCTVEEEGVDIGKYPPCFEIANGDAAFDIFTKAPYSKDTLEWDYFRYLPMGEDTSTNYYAKAELELVELAKKEKGTSDE